MTHSTIFASIGLALCVAMAAGSATAATPAFSEPLTFQELHRIDDNVSAVEFSIMDTDGDGLVDPAEYASVDLTLDD